MADPEFIPPPSRREHVRRRRAERRRRIVLGALGAVLAVLVGLVATDTLRIPSSGASPSLTNERAGPTTTSSRAAPQRKIRRLLTSNDPLRLWIGGDSLAGSLGPSLGAITAKTGVVQPQYLSRVGSGLISGDIDWSKRAALEMSQLRPEVAVFIIGTNDAVVFSESNDAARYEQKVEQMMRVLVGDGTRDVFWIGAPVVKDKKVNQRVKAVNLIQETVARRFPQVTYVDSYEMFDDDAHNDAYTPTTVDPDTGKRILVRAGDGVHFTPEGGDLLAQNVFAMLDRDWHISAQAVPGQPKKVIQSPGSTQKEGTYRRSETGSRSASSGTTTTTRSTATTRATSATTLADTPTTAPTETTTTTGVAAGDGTGGT